jgi:hypothetical protein
VGVFLWTRYPCVALPRETRNPKPSIRQTARLNQIDPSQALKKTSLVPWKRARACVDCRGLQAHVGEASVVRFGASGTSLYSAGINAWPSVCVSNPRTCACHHRPPTLDATCACVDTHTHTTAARPPWTLHALAWTHTHTTAARPPWTLHTLYSAGTGVPRS